ncbi:hypothetical protein Rsub_02924 [Raphidocelis subcapitata]|uniref:Uncharacterized protein n=1 Tax=Raphidocelis subcapitata TaxID=307507 RepID=A0A2V0NQ58_9CHLO|nr:hypothetical protein Rsub_02924 [Raphidocelis subcapitata]|eukprot:GBF89754.1 hypothetical protein Rsub_02924 [Raphidocelis subcapitata]
MRSTASATAAPWLAPARPPSSAARRPVPKSTSAFVGAATAEEGLLFAVEGTIPRARAASDDRDLSVEATIIDAAEIASPPADRDPLRGLRRAAAAHAAAAGSGAGEDAVSALAEALADALEATGARVVVRSPAAAVGGAPARAGVRGAAAEAFVLRGRFIVVKGRGDGREDGVIIDPAFREVFRTAPATPGYARLVESLPATFVGDASALRRLVALVAAQAARSYEAQGLSLPPWRRYSALIARWLPPARRYTDTPVTPPSSPLARMGSDEAAALAFATAGAAAAGALARLAAAVPRAGGAPDGAPAPARIVRGFDLPAGAAPAVAY